MDILANIEAASIAGNHLKQYMAAASRLAGLNSSAAADGSQPPSTNLAEIGAALQALINPFGPLANVASLPTPQLPSSIPGLDPLLMAAALHSQQQQSRSAFNPPSLGVVPVAGQLQQLASSVHPMIPLQFGAEAKEQSTEGQQQNESGSAEHPQPTPTLSSLLAAATTTPQRPRHDGQEKSHPAKLRSPVAKRSRLSLPPKMEQTNGDQQSSGTIPSSASLLSALSTAVNFPLTAASPPTLPSPSCVPRGASTTAQKSPGDNTIATTLSCRRLSAMSTSSSSSGSTATTAMPLGMGMPRTPQRKPAEPIPAEKKDQAYYERRRKNNDAAKRSRDTRRMKEELTAQRATYLEQENIQLRAQLSMLRAEYQSLLLSSSSSSSAGPPIPNIFPNTNCDTPVKAPNPPMSSSSHVLASPTSTTTNEPQAAVGGSGTSTIAEEVAGGIR